MGTSFCLVSTHDHVFTLGIEEEFQIIDPETRELRSHIQQILADGKMILKEHVKAEMHQSVVELGTEICTDTASARQQVIQLRSELAEIAGLKTFRQEFAANTAGTNYRPRRITAGDDGTSTGEAARTRFVALVALSGVSCDAFEAEYPWPRLHGRRDTSTPPGRDAVSS